MVPPWAWLSARTSVSDDVKLPLPKACPASSFGAMVRIFYRFIRMKLHSRPEAAWQQALRAKTVADVMVPRVDIVGISIDTPLEETVKLIQQEAHSRYPVYRESLDDVFQLAHVAGPVVLHE